MRLRLSLVTALAASACSSGKAPSVFDFLPPLPPTGGPALAEAGAVTAQNQAAKLPAGPAAKGVIGDYYLQNDKIRLLIQAPGRVGEVLGFGGNPVNLDFPSGAAAGGTQFGEIAPFLNVSHTANFTRVEVVRDGRQGGAAVVRAFGHAAVLDYFNVSSFIFGLDILRFDPEVPPPLDVAATYALEPGQSHLRVTYTLFNRSDVPQSVAIGSFADTGGDVEVFTPGVGFGQGSYADLGRILASAKPVDYWVGQSDKSAYGVLPAARGVAEPRPNTGLTVAGVGVNIFDAASLLDAISTTNFVVPPKKGASYEIYLLLGVDAADIHGQVLKLRAKQTGTLQGRVSAQGSGAAVPGARVAALDAQNAPVAVATAQADGSYRFVLEPGTYALIADAVGWPRSASAQVTLAAGGTATSDIALPQTARLPYTVVDGQGRKVAAKLSFVGTDPSPPDSRFRDPRWIPLSHGLVRVVQTWRGSSDDDGVIEIEPGTYRVVVSRGNEYTLFDDSVTLSAGDNPRLSVTLHRVLDTAGYLATDFHQHGVNSPDATTPLRERIATYLAAGVEFIGSSDHDYLTDYGPIIREMGVEDQLGSMVGVETTPFDYGHFNAFPLPVKANLPNKGALDWGDDENPNFSPGQIFAAFRTLGAKVVQVNHARVIDARTTPASGFQAYFDRAALTFDLANGSFFGDTAKQPLPNDVLRIAVGEPLWSDNFDTLEIYNGFSPLPEGEVGDAKVEVLMRDWFNFLSVGKILTPMGNTDSHERGSDTVDAPRTYVRVPDDTAPGQLAHQDVLEGLTVRRDVVVTNGPFVTLHVNDDAQPAMGRLIADADGIVDLTVKVQAPPWMPVSEVKIFSNNTYRIPPPGPTHDPMAPRVTVRLSESPGAGETKLDRKTVVEGVSGAWRYEAEVKIPGFALPDPGKDAWIVAVVRGTRGLYPWIPSAIGSASVDDLKACNLNGACAASGGVFPIAVTSAAFVDRDGNGRYDAPLAR